VLCINDDELPAWMVCDAIISKMRDELLSRAVALMHEQLDKKRISLEGHLPTMSEESSEKEKDAFLLSQLVKEHTNIERQFGEYIERANIGRDGAQRIDELQRFLLELRQIVMLKDYSRECEFWLAEVEKRLKERDAARILANTMASERGKRREVLEFVLKDREIAKDGVFSEDEKRVMEEALALSGG
jgi:hypothetical protein